MSLWKKTFNSIIKTGIAMSKQQNITNQISESHSNFSQNNEKNLQNSDESNVKDNKNLAIIIGIISLFIALFYFAPCLIITVIAVIYLLTMNK